jgi:disulfide bond formation protein DsbB
MKIAIRIFALTLAIAGAVAGTAMERTSDITSVHASTMPGPVPACNPFSQKCPNLR